MIPRHAAQLSTATIALSALLTGCVASLGGDAPGAAGSAPEVAGQGLSPGGEGAGATASLPHGGATAGAPPAIGGNPAGGGSTGGGGATPTVEACQAPSCGSCVPIIVDPLDGSTLGARHGGSFTAGGWQTSHLDDRVVYDLGSGIDCGAVELTVRNFDPGSQYTHRSEPVDCDQVDCYLHALSLYQGDHGSHHTAANNCESMLKLQATGVETIGNFERHRRIKLKTATFGWAGGGNSYTPKHSWDPAEIHHLELRWSSAGTELHLDGQLEASVSLKWPGDADFVAAPAHCTGPADCRMKLRHLFVGRDKNAAGGFLDGPIYSDLTVYDCSGA